MAEVNLAAKERKDLGKQEVKRLRKRGIIPAVVYGRNIESKPIEINRDDFIKVLHTSAGENVIVKLDILKDTREGSAKKENVNAIIKEIQHEPVTEDVLHVDFAKVSLTEDIVVKVPIKTKGESIGVTRDKGILEVLLWEFEIKCLPTNIPEEIDVHIDNLEIGDTVHVRDINFPEGVKCLNDPEQTVISIAPPREIEEEEIEEEEIIEEPEVIREKEKKEEEEETRETEEEEKATE